MPHLTTLDIDGLEDMPAGGCGWKAAAGVLASCLSLALQIHNTPCVSTQMQESFSRKSVSEFQLKGAHCVQYMMAGATPDLHSMHITLYSTVDAASEMHCDAWRSQTSKGNKRMPEQFTFVI